VPDASWTLPTADAFEITQAAIDIFNVTDIPTLEQVSDLYRITAAEGAAGGLGLGSPDLSAADQIPDDAPQKSIITRGEIMGYAQMLLRVFNRAHRQEGGLVPQELSPQGSPQQGSPQQMISPPQSPQDQKTVELRRAALKASDAASGDLQARSAEMVQGTIRDVVDSSRTRSSPVGNVDKGRKNNNNAVSSGATGSATGSAVKNSKSPGGRSTPGNVPNLDIAGIEQRTPDVPAGGGVNAFWREHDMHLPSSQRQDGPARSPLLTMTGKSASQDNNTKPTPCVRYMEPNTQWPTAPYVEQFVNAEARSLLWESMGELDNVRIR
jgi:hypothetical protein